MPTHSPKRRTGVVVSRAVLTVPEFWYSSKVDSSVVETVPIDMVPFESVARLESKQLSVHADSSFHFMCLFGSDCVPILSAQMPLPLSGPRGLTVVNDGMALNMTIPGGERDSGDPIAKKLNGTLCLLPFIRTGRRAKQRFPTSNNRGFGKKDGRACQTRPFNGTLVRHQATPGVSPRTVARRGGTSRCVDYTMPFRVEAAW
jgi:hypothetical protein